MADHTSFLATARTTPSEIRDFAEWHGGVSHYGFWAIVVDAPQWLALFDRARSYVGRFIHPDYRRAPHITVAACGLLSEAYFSEQQQREQATALRRAALPPFALEAGMLGSFAAAPFISVGDPSGALDRLRSVLSAIAAEDNPPAYRPHVTLGLYRDAFETRQVAEHLGSFRPGAIEALCVSEIAFCAYETRHIQGPFTVRERISIADTP